MNSININSCKPQRHKIKSTKQKLSKMGKGKPRTRRTHVNQAGDSGQGVAILKTWSPETEAGAGSQPESCGNVRKMLTAV